MRNNKTNIFLTVLAVLCYSFCLVVSSHGDRSPYYETCVSNCMKRNCTVGNPLLFNEKGAALQDPWARRLGWGCQDECRYHCMWRTVTAFQERQFTIPKFHGKWPFERILGMQEPASVVASWLNLASHCYMYWQLARDRRFSVRTTPLLIFWHFFFLVCAHGWVWSMVFHAHDTLATELMDYAGAYSIVMIHLVAAVLRLLYRKRKMAAIVLLCLLLYFVEHVRYLFSGDVDYEYHLTVNIITGMLATALWMLFSLGALCGAGAGAGAGGGAGAGSKGPLARRYVWRMVVFCKLTGAAVLLELFDFPPYGWFLDAHALWHFCTAPLPLLFYRFVIDDLDYLQTSAGYHRIEKKTDTKLL